MIATGVSFKKPVIYNHERMQPTRIAELLAPFLETSSDVASLSIRCHSEHAQSAGEEPAFLPPVTLQSISTYIDILLRWNARINLTAIRDEEEIVTRHFGESLFAARHLLPRNAHGAADALVRPAERSSASTNDHENPALTTTWKSGASAPRQAIRQENAVIPSEDFALPRQSETAVEGLVASPSPTMRLADLGSGAGFPGIPIKLFAPEIHLTLIESNHKKSTFLREVARTLTLTDIDILTTRAESLDPSLQHSFNVVTLRAVERFDQILPTAATLLAPNARLALLIGSSQLVPAREALPELSWSAPLPIPQAQSRILLIGMRPA